MKKPNNQLTVLLVEDDVMTAVTYKAALKDEPIFLTHLETGHATFAYLQNMVPNVMLLDLGLPDSKWHGYFEICLSTTTQLCSYRYHDGKYRRYYC
jgi:DNA-binding response OmpR family regulator